MKRAWPPCVGLVVPMLAMAVVAAMGVAPCRAASARNLDAGGPPPPAVADRDSYGRVRLPAGAHVLVLGDTLVGPPDALPGAKLKAGRDLGVAPYTDTLATLLGPQVSLTLETRPGARLDEAIAAFPGYPHADATILLFGPGDLWGGASPLSPQMFSAKLRTLIGLAQATGAQVILVTPPPAKPPLNGQMQPYRGVVATQGHVANATVVDMPAKLNAVKHLWTDGVHLDKAGSRILARLVADQFVPPAGR